MDRDIVVAATSFGERALMAGVIFSLFCLAAWIGARLLRRLLARWPWLDQDLINLAASTAIVLAVGFGAITALGTAGIDVTALVAGLGLTGFALGFALRDMVSNVIAGVLVLLYRPFHRGDTIAVAGSKGAVRRIDLRYTTIENEEGRVLIPNATLFSNPVTVYAPPPLAPAAPAET